MNVNPACSVENELLLFENGRFMLNNKNPPLKLYSPTPSIAVQSGNLGSERTEVTQRCCSFLQKRFPANTIKTPSGGRGWLMWSCWTCKTTVWPSYHQTSWSRWCPSGSSTSTRTGAGGNPFTRLFLLVQKNFNMCVIAFETFGAN